MRISDWSSDVCSSDLTPEHALAAADAADKARAAGETLQPLAGVPIGMKDLFCTKGVPSTAGSHILEGVTPPYESTVQRSEEHTSELQSLMPNPHDVFRLKKQHTTRSKEEKQQ